ncbi:multiple sugar transport system substrate-binding protein [Kribbella aluminosa]|uniref:Multiple sugar transport system substrate-binding protein n=1 Tax=Kribbella aluminosa TaxID=416017 RepID=A0ABS4UJU9_9ACTN|nr:extracellular solute-binding protein [Kribbella aluminosa]MBP2351933.1 multiple sugar transport system substrate-binding protein [Kribbella aluminosa]
MRHRRLRILVASAVAATLALAGCGSSGNSGSSGGKGGTTEITFWQQQFEPYQQKWFKTYVDKFNASQTAVKVKYQVVPGDTWTQKLKAAQAAGTQPDVATTNYGGIPAGVANGQFAELDGLLPGKAWDDIKPNVSGFVKVDGKHYAYPMLVEPSTVLYYRKDLVTAAGLDPNSPPKTWDELLTWAQKLTKGTVKGMSIASVAPDLGWSSWGLQYNACGHLPINDDWSAANAKDPCYAKLFQLYQTLFQKGWIPQQPKVGYADASPYGQGQVAMMADGSWAVGQLKQSFPAMIKNTMVAPFPSVDGDPSKPTATLGGWTLTVDGKSKQKEAAAKFIDYLLAGDPAIMADFFRQSGFSKYTVRTSVDKALASDPAATSDPFMKIISDKVVATGKAEPAYPFDISLAFATAIESVMKGKSDIPSATQKASDAIDRVIKQQHLKGTAPKG